MHVQNNILLINFFIFSFLFTQTLLSPIICCGPSTVKLLKPAILSFEHSASLQHAAWKLHVLSCKGSPAATGDQPWEKLITLGEERVDTPIYTQLDGSQVNVTIVSLLYDFQFEVYILLLYIRVCTDQLALCNLIKYFLHNYNN